jgi:hypothetical protein
MAVTVLFNAMKAFSRFRLWRIDAAREKLVARLGQLAAPSPSRPGVDAAPSELRDQASRTAAESMLQELTALRARCQRQVASMVTPMGDEMFYRYQQHLIEDATAMLDALLQSGGGEESARLTPPRRAGSAS